MASDFDHSDFRRYLAYLGGAAVAVGVGAYSLADYVAQLGDLPGIAEYPLEIVSAVAGTVAGISLGDKMYETGIKRTLRGVLNFFYVASSTFIGGKGGIELGELITNNVEGSEAAKDSLETILAIIGGTIGLAAGIKIKKVINEYNKKNSTQ